jgi:hypothetical protein
MDKFIEDGSIKLGGVMHRFQHDRAIRAYCAYTGMEHPSIDDYGAVFASNGEDDIQIGWIN